MLEINFFLIAIIIFVMGFAVFLMIKKKVEKPMKKEEAEQLIIDELQRGKYGGEYNYNFKPQLLPSPKNSVIIELSDPEIENGVFEDDNVIITLDAKAMIQDCIKRGHDAPLTAMSSRNEKFSGKYSSFLLENFPGGKGLLPINAILVDCKSAFIDQLDRGKVKIFSKREKKYVHSIVKSWWETINNGGYGYYLPDKTGFFRVRTMSIDR